MRWTATRSDEGLQLAELQLRRRQPGSITFRSVGAALVWYFETSEKLKGANAMHPRTETAPGGAQVRVQVDGGRGGDLDGMMATLASVDQALDRLAEAAAVHFPRAGAVPLERYRELVELTYIGSRDRSPPGVERNSSRDRTWCPWLQTEIAGEMGVSVRTVSEHLGRAERVLATLLVGVVT